VGDGSAARVRHFTHETVRDWEVRFGPLLAEHLCRKRHKHTGRTWYVDETYVAVKGKWVYLYRAIDKHWAIGGRPAERASGSGAGESILPPMVPAVPSSC
jgi:hypothetical protein